MSTLLLMTKNLKVRSWIKQELDPLFFVISISHFHSALEIITSSSLDLLILDEAFDTVAPFALIQQLRKQVPPQIPLFLITQKLKKSYRQKAIALGVTHFLDLLDHEELHLQIQGIQKAAALRKKTNALSQLTSLSNPKSAPSPLSARTLLNPRALRLLALAKETHQNISLLILRIDSFEDLPNPEKLLFPIFDQISKFLRADDLLIPYSEGRFILLLPNTDLLKAQVVAKQLQQEIQKKPFFIEKIPFYLTLSVAISPVSSEDSKHEQLIYRISHSLPTGKNSSKFLFPQSLS